MGNKLLKLEGESELFHTLWKQHSGEKCDGHEECKFEMHHARGVF